MPDDPGDPRGAGEVLTKLDGLAAAQLRMEALLDGVSRDLGALAAQLDRRSYKCADAPPADKKDSSGGPEDAGQERAKRSRKTSIVSCGDCADEGLEVPLCLPQGWPASVPARQDLIDRETVVMRNMAVVKAEESQQTVVDEMSVSVRYQPGAARRVMVRPDSAVHTAYSLLMLLVMMVDSVLVPYLLAWDVTPEGFLLAAVWASCCFWTIDVGMSCITGYQEHGQLELRTAAVVRRYARSWMLPDLIILSSDWFGLISAAVTSQSQGASGLKILRIAKAAKLLRVLGLFRMMKALRLVEQILEHSLSDTMRSILRCLMVIFGMLWVNHLFGCAWYWVGRSAPSDTGMRWVDVVRTWRGKDTAFLEFDVWHQYITSFQWSVAQLTLGATDIVALNSVERAFHVFMLTLGVMFGSTLVSILSADMVDAQMTKKDQTQRMRLLRRFLRENNISPGVASLVQQQAKERLSVNAKLQEEDVGALRILSRALRTSLRYELFRHQVQTHPLFRVLVEMDFAMVRELCVDALQSGLIRSQEDLFEPGPSAGNAYYLVSGRMNYSQEPSTAPVSECFTQSVQVGQWMCEAALWTDWVHVGTAKTHSLCQVVFVSGDDLAAVARRHPVAKEVCAEYCAVFHRRIVSAKPPRRPFPTDLQVPSTDFAQMVMSMSQDVRVRISLSSLDSIVQRRHASAPPQSCLPKLREEVRDLKCDLMIGASGQLERSVAVEVLRIESGEGKMLVELGKCEEDSSQFKVKCQLPAMKPFNGEDSDRSVARLLARFNLDMDTVDIAMAERADESTKSKDFGVITHYRRTVHPVVLRHDIMLPSFVPHSPAEADAIHRQFLQHAAHAPFLPELLVAPIYRVTKGGKHTFYSWLDADQVAHYSTPDGETELGFVLAGLGERDMCWAC